MPQLMLSRPRDRPPTADEIRQALSELYRAKAGGTFAGSRAHGRFLAFVVAFCDPADQYAANWITGEKAQLEWWQRDHLVTGFGISTLEPESHWDALECARRGRLQEAGLTAWFERPGPQNRFVGRFHFFRRSPRIETTGFRPIGREISALDLRAIIDTSR